MKDVDGEGAEGVFNAIRYPFLWKWFHLLREYMASLPDVEKRVEGSEEMAVDEAIEQLNDFPKLGADGMIQTPAAQLVDLDSKVGLYVGQGLKVSVAPDDTGRDDPMIGILIGLSPEEIVIEPIQVAGARTAIDVAVHFPRIGFVVKPVCKARL